MKSIRSEDEILKFIADISGPIGPEVFAGFGISIQNQISNEPLMTETIISRWIEDSDKTRLLYQLDHISQVRTTTKF